MKDFMAQIHNKSTFMLFGHQLNGNHVQSKES